MELHEEVLGSVRSLFDAPLIQNNLRGVYIEHLVSILLGDEWKLISADWSAWDLEHADGTRLEVKQSAAKQTWPAPANSKAQRNFSIRKPVFVWENDVRVAVSSRQASIYIFAWHSESSVSADHRDASQWQFFVLPEKALPNQKTIGLNSLSALVEPVLFSHLGKCVEGIRMRGRMT